MLNLQTRRNRDYPFNERSVNDEALPTPAPRDFHGAAVIDSCGREIPLTAEMIDQALARLCRETDQHKTLSFTPF